MKNYMCLTLAATALMAGFGSCSKEEVIIDQSQKTGEPTKMSLSIAQPKTYAEDGYATPEEVIISTVDVFIYGTSGDFQKRERRDRADFDELDDNIWKLKDAKSITTTVGQKKIYVAVNLPLALAHSIEGTNPGKIEQTVTGVSDLYSSEKGISMFSRKEETPDLVATTDNVVPEANKVTVTVARLLAKVIVEESPSLEKSIAGGTIRDLEFTVSNVNTKFFPLPDMETYKDPNWTSLWTNLSDFIDPGNYLEVNSFGAKANLPATKSIYTTENTSASNVHGDHTYAAVRCTFVPDRIVRLNASKDAVEEDPDSGYKPGDDFFLVAAEGVRSFFASPEDAADYATRSNSSVIKYEKGACYYAAFLNPTPEAGKEKKYDVLRNTIYRVTITKINNLGTPTDGIGEGGDDGTDPTGTDPTTPISDYTQMSVTVNVESWSEITQNTEL